jgi:hypothetical protein
MEWEANSLLAAGGDGSVRLISKQISEEWVMNFSD